MLTQKNHQLFSSHVHRKKIQFKNSWHVFIYSNCFLIEICFSTLSLFSPHFILYSQIVHHWMRGISRHLLLHFFSLEIKESWERSEEIIIINKFLHLQYDSHSQTSRYTTIRYTMFYARLASESFMIDHWIHKFSSRLQNLEWEKKDALFKSSACCMRMMKKATNIHTCLINRRIM